MCTMNIIHFQGLNCYHDCIISIVNHFGVNYTDAFATLWSETDFRYDPYRQAYLTKRMLTILESLGAKVENLDCPSQKDVERNLSLLHESEFMIVGMDAFYIPWNQFYQIFHGPHYFIAQNSEKGMLLCIDPTYNKENEQIARQEIIEHTFDMSRVIMVAKKTMQIGIIYEAEEILLTHPITRQILLTRIYGCLNEESENIVLLAKYIDAMICNRYLYRFFLENNPLSYSKNNLFRDNDFFLEWKAVKNGLYKASVIKNNKSIINDVCKCFNHLIDEEINMAEKIINGV